MVQGVDGEGQFRQLSLVLQDDPVEGYPILDVITVRLLVNIQDVKHHKIPLIGEDAVGVPQGEGVGSEAGVDGGRDFGDGAYGGLAVIDDGFGAVVIGRGDWGESVPQVEIWCQVGVVRTLLSPVLDRG